jgi:hypothetical protein
MVPEQADLSPAADHIPVAPVPLFDESELREFDKDDVEAGRNICKMLSLFFFYTVIVMGLSTIVTYRWVVNDEAPASAEAQAPTH